MDDKTYDLLVDLLESLADEREGLRDEKAPYIDSYRDPIAMELAERLCRESYGRRKPPEPTRFASD